MFGKILCWLGFHKNKTIAKTHCKLYSSDFFGNTQRDISGIARIEECQRCKSVKASIFDGTIEQGMYYKDALLMIPSLAKVYYRAKNKHLFS